MATRICLVWHNRETKKNCVDNHFISDKCNPDDALHDLADCLARMGGEIEKVIRIFDYCPMCDTTSPPRLAEGSCKLCCGCGDD